MSAFARLCSALLPSTSSASLTRSPSRWARPARAIAALALLSLAAAGCDISFQNTRMARGQLAVVGVSAYDDYFKKVHTEQVAGAAWADERRETRKALITSLGLLPDASTDVILAAIRARIKSQSVAAVATEVDPVAKAELTRADKVEGRAPFLEELANQGDDLRPNVAKDFPRDSSKRRDAENELGASSHELRQLAISARTHAREARRFAAELGEAVGASYLPKPQASAEPPSAPQASASTSSSAPTKKPPPAHTATHATPPKPPSEPKPTPPSEPKPPAPKPTGEVFTP